MHASILAKVAIAAGLTLILVGCLVSETAILDVKTGKARPLKDGGYIACPADSETGADDCQKLTVQYMQDRSYHFLAEDEAPSILRFRRIGRRGYVVQSREDDQEYAYYYGAGDASRMTLTMMICQELPQDLRRGLIDRGDLSVDGEDHDICTVKSVRGLVDAAKAYHQGRVQSDEPISMELMRSETE
ncbi:hypothetical protein [Hyphococcus sp.]|uniref:hypothetical protein n=1 Tax=Hyphococcus sp. TaxID=2038636 RepID=UPI003CCBB519